jgi:predicted amidohydrolase
MITYFMASCLNVPQFRINILLITLMTPADSLRITIIQPDIAWEDKAANLAHYSQLIEGIGGPKEIVVLPEMFSTGFSMAPERLAEGMDGATVQWMRDTAKANNIILTGSLILEEDGKYFNRLIWMQPNGTFGSYDKRHLFGYAGEDAHYAPGERRLIVQVKGWRICPLVCYDLRFPVWTRNTLGHAETTQDESENGPTRPAYDVLLYVANWPQRRSTAWKSLLQARAIENQSYCIGVNRVGEDGAGINYNGESSVFDPLGELLWQQAGSETVQTIELSRTLLDDTRGHLPFLKDADRFVIP